MSECQQRKKVERIDEWMNEAMMIQTNFHNLIFVLLYSSQREREREAESVRRIRKLNRDLTGHGLF